MTAWLEVPEESFRDELEERIEKGVAVLANLKAAATEAAAEAAQRAFRGWDDYNVTWLGRRFSTEDVADDYRSARPPMQMGRGIWEETLNTFQRIAQRRLDWLEEFMEQVPLHVNRKDETEATTVTSSLPSRQAIFLVHGHDEAIREQVRRFLEKATTVPVVILDEQASKGRVLLEKFEGYAKAASYAVVF